MKIKRLSKFDRPREKLAKYGTQRLADHELLAIILGSGIKGINVLQLSKNILKKIHSLKTVDIESLSRIKGLGPTRSSQICALFELSKRLSEPTTVVSPEKVFELCNDIRSSHKEHFLAFYLNSNNTLIARELISVGTLNESLVHPREVFEPALRHSASAIILAHNHPSGNVDPSKADLEVTKRLTDAGTLLGVDLVDHIVVTKGRFLSFKRQGLLSH